MQQPQHHYTPDGEVIFSVAELNLEAGKTLEQHFGECLVQGEITELKKYRSGHIYFTLKDERASIRCVLFRGKQFGLSFLPQDGDQVLVSAKLSIYQERGDFQIIVNHMELAGEGDLQQQFLALEDKLEKAGLFDHELKRTLPAFPKQLGVITSPDGAALQDILSVLKRRYPMLPIKVYASLVQGEQAASQLIKALNQANQDGLCDVIIIARGGGSIEDLWAFNNEQLAHAIYNSQIPIIAGVGHETDTTITDLVADVRAATPSAAAERVSPDTPSLLRQLNTAQQQLTYKIDKRLDQYKNQLQQLQYRLNSQHPTNQLQRQSQHLDMLTQRLSHCSPKKKIKQNKEQVLVHAEILNKTIHRKIKLEQQRFISLTEKLNLVSPLATLSRGFSITKKDNNIIKSVDFIEVQDNLSITLQDGEINCQVIQKTKKS